MGSIIKATLLAVVVFNSLTTPSLAGRLEDGESAYSNGDYATALRLWKPLAEQGNTQVLNAIGLLYLKGVGVPQDPGTAAQLFRRAAEQGDISGQNNLARMYLEGLGVPQNNFEAARLYRLAAEQGDSDAQYFLGVLYWQGDRIPQDLVEAYTWLSLSSDEMAQRLARMLSKALTPEEKARAEKLINDRR